MISYLTHEKFDFTEDKRFLHQNRFGSFWMILQAFALVNHEAKIDQIKGFGDWSECIRQARAACYIAFTGFLYWRTKGIIPKAIANQEGHEKTVFKVTISCKRPRCAKRNGAAFLEELDEISPRECLIAKVMLQGGKKVREVLDCEVDQIRLDRRKIYFRQSKMKGMKKVTGHASASMAAAYNKTSQEINTTEKLQLVS